MPRGGGSIRAGGVYHVISRFTAREWFIESAVERRVYLALLARAISKTDWACLCYALMSNHIHLGLVAGRMRLAAWLRPMHTTFAEWLNERRNRIGSVFVKGPNVTEYAPDRAGRLIEYIHRNPVRAGIVTRMEDSDWTSHRAYVGIAERPRWLAVERGIALAGLTDAKSFAEWSAEAATTREELEASRVTPLARPGRPRKLCARQA
ncbi:MAG: transposase [Kofleriaceae bacterium]